MELVDYSNFFSASNQKHLTVKKGAQGWTDSRFVLSGILLNLAGGNCVDDLNILNADQGFCSILHSAENHQLPCKDRREIERRWRKEKQRFIPSPSAMFRYLGVFHDVAQEQLRQGILKGVEMQRRSASKILPEL